MVGGGFAMRRRKLRWVLMLLAAALSVSMALFVRSAIEKAGQPPSQSVMAKNAHRIVGGMTAREVVALLGGPPGDYSTGGGSTTRSLKRYPPPGGSVAEWLTD